MDKNNTAGSGCMGFLAALVMLGLMLGGCYLMAASTIAQIFGG